MKPIHEPRIQRQVLRRRKQLPDVQRHAEMQIDLTQGAVNFIKRPPEGAIMAGIWLRYPIERLQRVLNIGLFALP
jgi:hypothetical protein